MAVGFGWTRIVKVNIYIPILTLRDDPSTIRSPKWWTQCARVLLGDRCLVKTRKNPWAPDIQGKTITQGRVSEQSFFGLRREIDPM